MTNWRAAVVGFLVITVLGAVGIVVPGLGQLTAGLVGGFVAGYMAGGSLSSGAWHGLVAGSLGGIVAAVVLWFGLTVLGFVGGPVGAAIGSLGGLVLALAVIAFSMIVALESAVAGAIGAAVAGDGEQRRRSATR
ncbi:DUF5518 domain-containing protein [Natronoarchaeum rubrum]|uniref:DUF5518 domain-containing protein n=1 Tax=Natronoarchaeum rubrum TaxID=755311 RepID=UPI0021125C08|nr:DUF5518 domain-containing protein [Natronoarchaeum rubrum]